MKDHFEMFAAYNRWANRTVYAATRALAEEDRNRHQGAFFGSMMGTLNHLLCADRIWLKRFTGEGDAPSTLDAAGLSNAQLAATFSYTPLTNPKLVTQRLGSALSHLFNHQTHHRGQCHAILTSLGGPSLTLDLVAFQRLHENGRFL